MDIGLISILAIVVIICIIIYRTTTPKALEVIDKPVEAAPLAEKPKRAPAKKPKATSKPNVVVRKTKPVTKSTIGKSSAKNPKSKS